LAALFFAVPLAADALRVAPVKDSVVVKECSACQMLYPAGLLPARSWSAMIADLANHFGDNAELDPATAKRVADYLTANSADGVGVSGKVLRGLDPVLVPKRITELPWWTRKHEKKVASEQWSLPAKAPSSRATARPATPMPNAAFSTMMSDFWSTLLVGGRSVSPDTNRD
jgi:hypothetical protein